jgi:hypothetical protein
MNPAYRSTQLAHIDECIALTERVPTSSELLEAASLLGLKAYLAPGARLEIEEE